jgi:cobalt-zinc-cadmium efflux system outer membrane protein
MTLPRLLLLSSLVALASCNKHAKDDGSWVQETVQQRIEKQVHWYQGTEADALVREKIASLLERELQVEDAVQIALLQNPSLQATFEEIGIAQADLVEAGLFQNPFLDGYVRFPSSLYSGINASLNLVTSFLDLFMVPLKKKTAALKFEEAKMRVAHQVLNLAAEVEQTFYALQTALLKAEWQRTLIDAATAAQTLSERQSQTGNSNPLFVESKQAECIQTQLELAQTEIELISLEQKLSMHMGVDEPELTICASLPDLPEQEIPLEDLEALALSERLDVAAARKQVESIASIGAQKKWWAYTNGKIGISTEHQSEGFWDTGPAFGLALPFFNHGQADRARLYAEFRQAQDHLEALTLETKLQVRAARDQVLQARAITEAYAQQVLPLREKILGIAQKQYNVMAYGVYDLLQLKQEEIRSQIAHAMALRDYWIARSSLDLYIGGKLELKNSE